jgi:UDP-N-acetylmuramate-alanine ligase
MKSFDQIQRVYFSGIGGIGMSALAQLLHAEGKTVLGSDLNKSEMTERLQLRGIPVAFVQDGAGMNRNGNLCIVIVTLLEQLLNVRRGVLRMGVGHSGDRVDHIVANQLGGLFDRIEYSVV